MLVAAIGLASVITTTASAQVVDDRYTNLYQQVSPSKGKKETENTTPQHATQIVAHPAGCPRRAFCGCGASVELFGKAVTRGGLALARNWLHMFEPAAPAPGMAAANNRHVFVIKQVLGNGNVLAYDANSGKHQTRVHVRSLKGYRVVNPQAPKRLASVGTNGPTSPNL